MTDQPGNLKEAGMPPDQGPQTSGAIGDDDLSNLNKPDDDGFDTSQAESLDSLSLAANRDCDNPGDWTPNLERNRPTTDKRAKQ